MDKERRRVLVTIIVVNYNGMRYLGRCLNSLFSMDYPLEEVEIIVVDNGSSDGSLEFIQSNFPMVKILKNSVNTSLK